MMTKIDNEAPAASPARLRDTSRVILVLPYKLEGSWVFDDERTGLVEEAFVAGIDLMLDVVTASIPNASEGFLAEFSARALVGAQLQLCWIATDDGRWNEYEWASTAMRGKLCPSLYLYFPRPPRRLWMRASALEHR